MCVDVIWGQCYLGNGVRSGNAVLAICCFAVFPIGLEVIVDIHITICYDKYYHICSDCLDRSRLEHCHVFGREKQTMRCTTADEVGNWVHTWALSPILQRKRQHSPNFRSPLIPFFTSSKLLYSIFQRGHSSPQIILYPPNPVSQTQLRKRDLPS